MAGPYDDIIYLPHPTSKNHPRMSRQDRAAQFLPFAALTGYDEEIEEAARLTEQKVELDEYEKAALNERLRIIQGHLAEQPEIVCTYFIPDENSRYHDSRMISSEKSGGAYVNVVGRVKKIDAFEQVVVLTDGTKIPVDAILEIGGELFTDNSM